MRASLMHRSPSLRTIWDSMTFSVATDSNPASRIWSASSRRGVVESSFQFLMMGSSIPLEIGSAPLVLRGNTFCLCYYFVKYSHSRAVPFRNFTTSYKISIFYKYVHSMCEKQTDISLTGFHGKFQKTIGVIYSSIVYTQTPYAYILY